MNVENTQIALTGGVPTDPVARTLAVIERLALDPAVDVSKMQALLEMQMTVMNKQAEMEYNAAMIRLQEKMPRITKAGAIEFSGKDKGGAAYTQKTAYARLEDIDRTIRPIMREEGFSVTYLTEGTDKVVIKCKISHKGGHSEISSMMLPLDTSGSKNNLQGAGSSISYGRRYALCAMLNIITVGEDDDGLGGPITHDQAVEIDVMIAEVKMDKAKFLKLMKVDDVRDIKTREYARAVNALKAKAYDNEKGKKK